MGLSSLFTKLRTRLYQKLILRTIPQPPKSPRHIRNIVPIQPVQDEIAEISKACVEVRSAVNVALRRVIEIEAGTSGTRKVAQLTADRISEWLSNFTEYFNDEVDEIARGYNLDWTSNRIKTSRRLKSILKSMIRHRDRKSSAVSMYISYMAKVEFDNLQRKMIRRAIEGADADITNAVSDTLISHMDTSPLDRKSLRFIRELAVALTEAASQEAKIVADATKLDDLVRHASSNLDLTEF
ncbi:hypothetical protein M426DRAFT_17238 [Hypoxylon sp. CI-4A]|nr:hypothetical protein M426DRAFT_17238 [Hypoxylon sp. CI-4A]